MNLIEQPQFEKREFLKVDLEGGDSELWKKLRDKLTSLVMELLDFNVDKEQADYTNQELDKIKETLLNYSKSPSQGSNLKQFKLMAEIECILANKAKTLAEAKKLDAEAAQRKLVTTKERLRLALGITKALAHANNDTVMILFTKNVEELVFMFQENNIA
jgi:hypothetical protein